MSHTQEYALLRYSEAAEQKKGKAHPHWEADALRDAPLIIDAMAWLLDELRPWGAFIYHEATTGSRYIKFPHWALGSIQIRNHRGLRNGKEDRYKYKWTVRVDLEPQRTYGLYNHQELEHLVLDFCGNADAKGILPGDHQTWEEFKGTPMPKFKARAYRRAGVEV